MFAASSLEKTTNCLASVSAGRGNNRLQLTTLVVASRRWREKFIADEKKKKIARVKYVYRCVSIDVIAVYP